MADRPEGSRPERAPAAADPASNRLSDAQQLVESLASSFREQVRRALGVELDGSETSLAFVDHHLRQASDESREAILTLLAASAGAYYGELVREHVGATWIGDGEDPRALRLLLRPQFLYFSPIDQALEAIVGESLEPDDTRLPPGPAHDPAFHLTPIHPEEEDDETHDAVWLHARLAELAPVPADQFHSLTCRFETLTLMLELLATKHVGEGRPPVDHGLEQYLEVIQRPH